MSFRFNNIGGLLISSLELFKDLIKSPYLREIENIRENLKELLEKPILIHFTDHSINHSDRMVKLIYDIIGENNNRISEYELFILLISAYVHDIGMQIPLAHGISKSTNELNEEDYKKIRENHGEISAQIIEILPEKDTYKLNLSFNKPLLSDAIGSICYIISNHQSKRIYDPCKVIKCPKGAIKVGLLTSILRIVDTLDCTRERVNMNKLHQYAIPQTSIIHWVSCYYIESIIIENGLITITSTYPENLSSSHVDYLNKELVNKIEFELRYKFDKNIAEVELWKNNIKLKFEKEIEKQDNKYSSTRWLPLPEWVKDEIENKIRIDYPKFTKSKKEIIKKINNWIAYWNFIGNPFLDEPQAYGSKNFVETDFYESISSEINEYIKSNKGAIKLLIGERGLGKTTFFNYLQGKFKDICQVDIIDAADIATSSETATQFYNNLFDRTNSVFGYYENFNKNDLIKNIKKSDLRIICIDSLDRLPDDKIKILDEFFKQSQHLLTYMKKNIILILSCSDKWKNYLDSKELSYLGYKNQWFLPLFNTKDTKKMLTNRINSAGRELNEIFTRNAIAPLHTISNHNPREILINAENLSRFGFHQKVSIINNDLIQKHFNTDLKNKYEDFLSKKCKNDTKFENGLKSVYFFFVDIDRRNLSRNDGVEIISQLIEGKVVVNPTFFRYSIPLKSITIMHITNDSGMIDKKYELNDETKHFFRIVRNFGYDPKDFISFFSLNPTLPKEIDDIIFKSGSIKDDDSIHFHFFEKARNIYMETMKKEIGFGYSIYLKSWDVIENLIVAILVKKNILNHHEYDVMKDSIFYYDSYGIKRHKTGSGKILAEQAMKITGMLVKNRKSKEIPFIYNLANINWIRNTRNLIIKSPSNIYDKFESSEDKELCKMHLASCFKELAEIYLKL